MALSRLCVDLFSGDQVTSFADAYAAGIRLIIHKASEGATFKDTAYATRRPQALAAGMLWGAYHFGNGAPVADQVANFLAVAQIYQMDANARLVLDWEQSSMTVAMAREFMRSVDAKTGRQTILYSYASFLQEQLGSVADAFFGSHPLWLAAYRAPPAPKPQISWDRLLLWQDTETARIPGLPGTATGVDASLFDGTEEELRAAWLGTPSVIDPPFALPPDPLEAMKSIQKKLVAAGFDPGPVDGIIGDRTKAALQGWALKQLG